VLTYLTMPTAYLETLQPIVDWVFELGGETMAEPLAPEELLRAIASPLVRADACKPFEVLERRVRHAWEAGPPQKGRSGIHYPEEVVAARVDAPPNLSRIVLRQVGVWGVRVGQIGTDVFLVGNNGHSGRAVQIGRVPRFGCPAEFGNVSPKLGDGLAAQLSKLALADFYYRATYNQYND
jgi:hypothetical protein